MTTDIVKLEHTEKKIIRDGNEMQNEKWELRKQQKYQLKVTLSTKQKQTVIAKKK